MVTQANVGASLGLGARLVPGKPGRRRRRRRRRRRCWAMRFALQVAGLAATVLVLGFFSARRPSDAHRLRQRGNRHSRRSAARAADRVGRQPHDRGRDRHSRRDPDHARRFSLARRSGARRAYLADAAAVSSSCLPSCCRRRWRGRYEPTACTSRPSKIRRGDATGDALASASADRGCGLSRRHADPEALLTRAAPPVAHRAHAVRAGRLAAARDGSGGLASRGWRSFALRSRRCAVNMSDLCAQTTRRARHCARGGARSPSSEQDDRAGMRDSATSCATCRWTT